MEADGEMIELRDLFDIRLHGDDLRGFQTEWDSNLIVMKDVNEGIKETLYYRQVSKRPAIEGTHCSL